MASLRLLAPELQGIAARDRLATGALVGAGGVLLGACTVLSPQLGCALALVGCVVLLSVVSPRFGLLALWALWLLTPGLRRVFGLLGPYQEADPLSVAPVVATAAVAALHIARTRLDRQSRRTLLLAGAGLAIGIPAGAAVSPEAMLYGLTAYGAAVLAFVLGRGEPTTSGRELSLRRALVFWAPALALYGIAQYFFPLTSWDRLWLEAVDLESIGAPEAGHVRIFSTLNAPGALAPVLAIALLCLLTVRRLQALPVLAATILTIALALTYVRGTWLAFAVAALLVATLARTRTAILMVGVCAAMVVGALALGSATPTTRAFSERFGTLGTLESDVSAGERVARPVELVPEAISRPLGHGLGTAGEASRLGPESELENPDNGYLSLLYQLGPAGFLLVMAAALPPLAAIARRVIVERARDPESVLLFAVGAFVIVALFAGDLFYGVTGVILWYLLGRASALTARSRTQGSRPPWPVAR